MFASETDSICAKQAVVDGQQGMSDLGRQQTPTGMMDLAAQDCTTTLMRCTP